MPKKEINDYYFYKIICLDTDIDLCYVGSTANWKHRNGNHKSSCNNENAKNYNTKIYKIIRENSGWDNWKMVQIGFAEQLTVRQAETIEEEYRQQLKASMNDRRCFVTPEEKKEYFNKNAKQYYEANKEHSKERYKQYRVDNIDKIKEQHKQHYYANKDKYKQYPSFNKEHRKEYQDANKDKLKEQASRPYQCDCGSIVQWCQKSKHFRSEKHKNFIQIQELQKSTDI